MLRAGLSEVNEHDFLSEAERDQLRNGQEFLSQVRFALHSMTGRATTDCCLTTKKSSRRCGVWSMVTHWQLNSSCRFTTAG